jgi:NADH-quinone oxidoreductase subunit F
LASAFAAKLKNSGAACDLAPAAKRTGCHGLCEFGPVVRVEPENISYYQVRPEDVDEIYEKTIAGDEVIERLLYKDPFGKQFKTAAENPFYIPQVKIALRNVGEIDPLDMEEAVARGVYQALAKALEMPPEDIVDEMEASGLRGRGGAGFPTGKKWRYCAASKSDIKYVVCNCDEGDPGAFMDRSILEGDPHSVLEGIAIAAKAVGARQGFIYVRDEYEGAVRHAAAAIAAAQARGVLGRNILGSDMDFDIKVIRGGGAFVCGEETALINSIEGRTGEPRVKPPYPASSGLWGKPTLINNVETFANVAAILHSGAQKFREIGTRNSPGTKVFCLVGKIRRTGLIEVPMGITLRRIVYDIGGGMMNSRPFKAIQTGGPSGGCIPEALLDIEVDFDSLAEAGGMMGSGGMIVMDSCTCMVEFAQYYVKFLSGESCGKCTPCREGLRKLDAILTDIREGKGRLSDIDLMEDICQTMRKASLCGLGKSAPNPVLTALRHFRAEYVEHVEEKYCRAGVCPSLSAFHINFDACTGCSVCARNCPAAAIEGVKKKPHQINQSKCVQCGACRDVCQFNAVTAGRR